MNIAVRLANKLKERGLSQPKLADRIKTSRQTISQWVNGHTEPDGKNLLLCALELEEDPFSLQFGGDSDYTKKAINLGIISHKEALPLYKWDAIGDAEEKKVTSPIPVSKNAYALRIEDNSMITRHDEPSFPTGSIIIVEPVEDADIGKLVIIKHKTGKILFRKYVNTGLYLKFAPLNKAADGCLKDDAKIIGVVVASMNLDL